VRTLRNSVRIHLLADLAAACAIPGLGTWHRVHLRVEQSHGISKNAVKTRRWIAVSVYVLVANFRKRLGPRMSLDALLSVFSVTVFEKMSIQYAILPTPDRSDNVESNNRLRP
jgi:hypothetical protein